MTWPAVLAAGQGGEMSTRAPAFPRRPTTHLCALCGDRLIAGERPATRVHELTGSVRCPPVARACGVCERAGLVECYQFACRLVVHPGGGCGMACTCCGRWGCPAHVSPVDGLCIACASHPAGQHGPPATDPDHGRRGD